MIPVPVVDEDEGQRLAGEGGVIEAANAFLAHLEMHKYSPATVRAYAYALTSYATFLAGCDLESGRAVSQRVHVSGLAVASAGTSASRRRQGRCPAGIGPGNTSTDRP